MTTAAGVSALARRQVGTRGAVAPGRRAWAWRSVGAVLITLSLMLVGEGAPGDLDSTSGGGTVTTDFGGYEAANALVLQPDGKLVAAGFADGDFALARYLPDGSLDPSFGIGGTVTTDFGTGSMADALVLQPDGKLVAAGCFQCFDFNSGFAMARYWPDGRLDASFGVGGKVISEFPESANALVLQPDGKLVAAGESDNPVTFAIRFALARYLPDGTLDPTFGIGGKVTTDFGGPWAFVLLLQPDGKLVAGGPGYSGACCFGHFALGRYLPDGRLDATFGVGGIVTADFGGNSISTVVDALVLQPDGKLVAAGAGSDNCCTDRFALARFLPDGSLDPTFGVGGIVTTDFAPAGGDDSDQARALAMQPDGKLVAAGAVGVFSGDFGLARYLPDGRLDATFGTGFEVNVNALVTFEPLSATFTFTPDPNGCPEGFVGTFRFEARLTNSSESSLTDLVVADTTLTNGNLLQNADGCPGGIGARLTVPQQDGFSEGVLSPEEFVDVPFIICLTQQQPFAFVVDVLGVVEASTDADAKAQLVP